MLGLGQFAAQVHDAVTRPCPDAIATAVDEDSPEPRLEPGRVAQVGQSAPCCLGGVMYGVLGLDAVVEDHGRQPI